MYLLYLVQDGSIENGRETAKRKEREIVMQENTQKEENGQSLDIIDYTVLTSFLVVTLYYAADMAKYLAVPHHTLAMYFDFWGW